MAKKKRTNAEPAYEIRHLDRLRPHPLQEVYFGNTPESKIRALADDIERNSLKQPIEVLPRNQANLPDDTIITGHKRRLALQLLGYEQTEVEVRYDLADASAAEIELYFLDDNDNRQQLTRLEQARIALRRVEIEKNRDHGDLADWEHVEARDRVGAVIGMTGRNLNRYLRVLKTPASVQRAFENGELTLVAADKVAGLSDEIQSAIAEQIEARENAKQVVEAAVGAAAAKPKNVETIYWRYVRALANSVELLRDDLAEIKFSPKPEELAILQDATELNSRLVDRLQRNEERNAARRDRAMKKLRKLTSDGTR